MHSIGLTHKEIIRTNNHKLIKADLFNQGGSPHGGWDPMIPMIIRHFQTLVTKRLHPHDAAPTSLGVSPIRLSHHQAQRKQNYSALKYAKSNDSHNIMHRRSLVTTQVFGWVTLAVGFARASNHKPVCTDRQTHTHAHTGVLPAWDWHRKRRHQIRG